jgi:hypothetical protein
VGVGCNRLGGMSENPSDDGGWAGVIRTALYLAVGAAGAAFGLLLAEILKGLVGLL